MAASPIGVPVDLVVVTAPARPGWGTTLGRFIHRKPLGAAGGAIMLVVLALVMSASLGPSVRNVIVAISIPIIPRAARVIRASVLSIREMQYIEAARALGVRHLRTAFRHILPNTVGPFIVLCTAQLGSAILVEATLSFLGMGVPEPYPSWGRMLSVSAAEYAQKAPHLVLFPGIAISLAVFGSNLLGDALRDVLDPRLRGA